MKCNACGGTLVYDVKNQNLKCKHCDSIFEIENYKTDNSGKLSVNSFLCSRCGAELTAPDEQIVSYCMYCGSESTMIQKTAEIERPVNIIPFKLSKDYVKEEYVKQIRKFSFAPKEFTDPEFIDGFKGIYIPYWRTKAVLENKQFTAKGSSFSVEGAYDVTRYYDIDVSVHGEADSGDYDASSAFDDSVAKEIAPFYQNDIVTFNEGYLAGFYADKATTPVENYNCLRADKVKETVFKEVDEQTKDINLNKASVQKNVELKGDSSFSELYPVWFLTWRKKNRVSYSVMNGQTGKLSVDLPIDYKRFFGVTALVIAIFFLIISILPIFITPMRVACSSSIFLYISSLVLKFELKDTRFKENHINDIGNTNYYGTAELDSKEKKKKSKKRAPVLKTTSVAGVILLIFSLLLLAFVGLFSLGVSNYQEVTVIFSIMILYQVKEFISTMIQCAGIKNKIAVLPAIFALVVQFSGIVIADVNHPEDFWYLGLGMACFIGMILNCLTGIFYTNYLTTRPVPNFYSRKGAED